MSSKENQLLTYKQEVKNLEERENRDMFDKTTKNKIIKRMRRYKRIARIVERRKSSYSGITIMPRKTKDNKFLPRHIMRNCSILELKRA